MDKFMNSKWAGKKAEMRYQCLLHQSVKELDCS